MVLRLFGTEPASVFAIFGTDENSATFALGWVLEKSPTLLAAFVKDLIGVSLRPQEETVVELQRRHPDTGITDIELTCGNSGHIIIEAKRGWTLPNNAQLTRYARCLSKRARSIARIVSLSAASSEYARRRLPARVSGIPLLHRSWSNVSGTARTAYHAAKSLEEKMWIRELITHLQEFVSMQNPRDNLVFVVSLSPRPIRKGDSYSWIDVVETDKRYFHPVGNRWPVFPPNYIAFRYHGALQSVHHIDRSEVVTNLASKDPRWPDTDVDRFVYHLGPPMRPQNLVRTGNIYRNGRVWCAIDTLLSGAYKTISDARDETKRRLTMEAG
jgi:hypothetical protein